MFLFFFLFFVVQEPEFFSDTCAFQPHACALPAQDFYLHSTLRLGEVLSANLMAAGAEASSHYGRNGQLLAQGIREVRAAPLPLCPAAGVSRVHFGRLRRLSTRSAHLSMSL